MTSDYKLTFQELAKQQDVLDSNFKIVKDSLEEVENKMRDRRISILSAIDKEQKDDAARLSVIVEALKGMVGKTQQP